MEILESISLGIIQGITEFVPVSSSGHLILVREFFGWQDRGLSFDVALHIGTLVAVVVYFRKLWVRIFQDLTTKSLRENRLILGIIIATIPAVTFGYLGEKIISQYFRSTLTVGAWLMIMGLLFLLIEKSTEQRKSVRSKEVLGWWDYLYIGLAQALALIPGVSRSGMTIVAGMDKGLSRREAAEFTFLLAVPVMLGAGLYDLLSYSSELRLNYFEAIVGFLIAMIVGYASIHFLMRFLSRRRLRAFAFYLFALGLIAVIFSLLRK